MLQDLPSPTPYRAQSLAHPVSCSSMHALATAGSCQLVLATAWRQLLPTRSREANIGPDSTHNQHPTNGRTRQLQTLALGGSSKWLHGRCHVPHTWLISHRSHAFSSNCHPLQT